MTEEWRPVSGFEKQYEVSDLGRIRRIVFNHRGTYMPRRAPRILRPVLNSRTGYARVCLCRDGRLKRPVLIHRIVLEAFRGPCPGGHEAGHQNDVRTDNRLANLSWITRQENHDQMTQRGRQNFRGLEMKVFGERHGNAKLTVVIVKEARRLAALGHPHRDLAVRFGVANATISQAISGYRWAHVIDEATKGVTP